MTAEDRRRSAAWEWLDSRGVWWLDLLADGSALLHRHVDHELDPSELRFAATVLRSDPELNDDRRAAHRDVVELFDPAPRREDDDEPAELCSVLWR